jgi:dodecin
LRKIVPRGTPCHASRPATQGGIMSIAKVIEISSSSTIGIEDAVRDGLSRAARTINNIKGAWVNDIKVITDASGKVTEWRVNMRINFVLD